MLYLILLWQNWTICCCLVENKNGLYKSSYEDDVRQKVFFFYKHNAYLIGMVNFLKWEPIESQKAVPQHPLVPDLNNQAGVKSHGFTIILKKNNHNINKTVKSRRQFFFFFYSMTDTYKHDSMMMRKSQMQKEICFIYCISYQIMYIIFHFGCVYRLFWGTGFCR